MGAGANRNPPGSGVGLGRGARKDLNPVPYLQLRLAHHHCFQTYWLQGGFSNPRLKQTRRHFQNDARADPWMPKLFRLEVAATLFPQLRMQRSPISLARDP